MSSIIIDADTSEFDQDLDEAKTRATNTLRSMISHMRRVAQFGIAVSTAMGRSLDAQYTLMIEGVLVTIDTLIQVQAAIAAGTFGTSALIQATLSGFAVYMMVQTIIQLRQGKAEAAAESQRTIQAFRIMSLSR